MNDYNNDIPPQQIDQRYNDLLVEYNRVKDEIKEADNEKEIAFEIERYSQLINDLEHAPVDGNTSNNLEAELSTRETTLTQLQKSISDEEEASNHINWKNQSEIDELNFKLNKKKQELQQFENKPIQEDENLPEDQPLSSSINKLQSLISDCSQEINSIADQRNENDESYAKQEKDFQFILSDTENKQERKKQILLQIETLEQSYKQVVDSFDRLTNELKLKREQNIKEKNNSQLGKIQNELESKMKQMQAKNQQWESLQKKIKENTLQLDKVKKEHEQKDQEGKRQKQSIQDKKKEEQILRVKIKEMKYEKEKAQEEKKKQKPKVERDFKVEILNLERGNDLLEKQIERQRGKLTEFYNKKKTYVKQQQLIALKNELNDLKKVSDPLDVHIQANKKFEERKKSLEESIAKLKGIQGRMIKQKESSLNQVKQKAKDLLENKNYYERSINHNKNKLEDYIKEFPNYEKEKEDRKQQEKKQIAEERRRKRIQQDERKKLNQKNKKQSEVEEEDSLKLPILEEEKPKQLRTNLVVAVGGALLVAAATGAAFYL